MLQVNSCEITLQDNKSIVATNGSDDLDNFQVVATSLERQRAESLCTAFNEALNSAWFYRILARSGLYPYFKRFTEEEIEVIPDEVLQALIESQGLVDAISLEKVCISLFGINNFTFFRSGTGELTIKVVPITEASLIAFLVGGDLVKANFQNGQLWEALQPAPVSLPAYEFWLREFFVAFGVKLIVAPIPTIYASTWYYKGSFTFNYNTSEVAIDSNNKLYVCDNAGNLWVSENLGGYWTKVLDNVFPASLYKKVAILKNATDERIVIFGGGEIASYHMINYSAISMNLDTDFYDNFGIVKTQDNKLYYYGGTDSTSNVSDTLYSITFDDSNDLIVATEKEDATSVLRKNPILTNMSNGKFCLTYSLDTSDTLLKDAYIFDTNVSGVNVISQALVLNDYISPAVFARRDFIYIAGGTDLSSTQVTSCEKIDFDFTAISAVATNIGVNITNASTVFIDNVDTVRILSGNNEVYGL